MKVDPAAMKEEEEENACRTSDKKEEAAVVYQYRHALTRCTVLGHGTYRGQPVTKVCLEPWTGRRHQLRCHMMMLGHAILGDATYHHHNKGETAASADAAATPDRMCLHSQHLSLPNILSVTTNDPFVLTKNGGEIMLQS